MNICLVYPNASPIPKQMQKALPLDRGRVLPPLGMLYVLRKGMEFIDNRILKMSGARLYSVLKTYDIVGFGGTIFEVKEARALSRKLRQRGVFTIYGGCNATANWNYYLGDFDLIFRGEAEGRIDKVFRKEFDGFSRVGDTLVNLDPFEKEVEYLPAREMVDLNVYKRSEPRYLGNVQPVDTVVSSRGCPWDCSFCSSRSIWGRRHTKRSASDVGDEIRMMVNAYGTKAIYFREDNFTADPMRLYSMCRELERIGLPWMCESRADLMEKTIDMMAEAGCKAIWFGIEVTTDSEMQRLKRLRLSRALETIKNCNDAGMFTGGSFMMGFPWDTEESIKRRHRDSKAMGLGNTFYNRVRAFPGSQLYKRVVDEGLDEMSWENIILPRTKHISAKRLNDLYYNLTCRRYAVKQKIKGVLCLK